MYPRIVRFRLLLVQRVPAAHCTSSYGAWTQSPSNYTFQWKADGTNIPGATARTLTLTDAEIGKTITVTVTASNSFGSTSATSAATAAVTEKPITVPPAVIAPPTLSGDALVGSVLMVSNGTWANKPTSYSYQWFKNGTALLGATANVFPLLVQDFGAYFSATVTATNPVGSISASTNNAGPISQAPPANTSAPTIAGTPRVGQTLTGSAGTWANDPTGFAFQWTRSGTNLPGATAETYLLVSTDATNEIGLRVTATNLGGTTMAMATPVGPVIEAPQSVNIVAEGDSITAGLGATDAAHTYPAVALTGLPEGPTYTLENIATAGIQTNTLDTDYDSRGGANFDVNSQLNVFTLMAGTNDKSSGIREDVDIYRSLRSILRKAKATGYQRRLIGTMISRNDGSPPGAQFDGNSEPVNQYIRAYWNTDLDCDGIFDFGNAEHFDTATNADDAAYYAADKLHLTDVGYAGLADVYRPVLAAAIEGPTTRSPMPAIWSPVDASNYLGLTNGNRTVAWNQPGFSNSSVRGFIGKSSGKWVFETVLDTAQYVSVGLMSEGFETYLYGNVLGPQESEFAIALGFGAPDDALTYNGTNILSLGTLVDGDVIQHAVDLDTRKYWVRKNGGPWNGGAPEGAPTIDPAAGVGGVDISGLGTGNIYPVGSIFAEGGQITANFAAGQINGSIPAGFQPLAS